MVVEVAGGEGSRGVAALVSLRCCCASDCLLSFYYYGVEFWMEGLERERIVPTVEWCYHKTRKLRSVALSVLRMGKVLHPSGKLGKVSGPRPCRHSIRHCRRLSIVA